MRIYSGWSYLGLREPELKHKDRCPQEPAAGYFFLIKNWSGAQHCKSTREDKGEPMIKPLKQQLIGVENGRSYVKTGLLSSLSHGSYTELLSSLSFSLWGSRFAGSAPRFKQGMKTMIQSKAEESISTYKERRLEEWKALDKGSELCWVATSQPVHSIECEARDRIIALEQSLTWCSPHQHYIASAHILCDRRCPRWARVVTMRSRSAGWVLFSVLTLPYCVVLFSIKTWWGPSENWAD